MKPERFNQEVRRIVERTMLMLTTKGKEYAPDTDRLANFKKGAIAKRTIPEDYLTALVTKQQISLEDYINELMVGINERPLQLWQEKLADIINYHILLECLIIERMERLEGRNPDEAD